MSDLHAWHKAQVAQLVEQRTENPCVAGSIPALGTIQGDGAGEGNRTPVVSLGSFCSTIELHPPLSYTRLSNVLNISQVVNA